MVLEDHHTADEINAGMAGGLGFEGTFGSFEETERKTWTVCATIFRRKAFVSRQEKLCRTLLADGYAPAELAGMRLRRHSVLGGEAEIPRAAGRSSGWMSQRKPRLWWTPTAGKVPEEAVVQHLRFARVTRLSIEANAGFCRGVLAARNKDMPGVSEKEAAYEGREVAPLRR